MCGIAGIVGGNFDKNNHPIRTMTEALVHRGPDAKGYHINGDVALGHTRLAVIDTSENANQPFTSQDGRYTLVYNGEVYNFREIRKRIPEYRFLTDSDTEVVLAAYIKWRVACLDLFNGMFAFGIWDARQKELFVARDRLGIKPLYYAEGDCFIFSSEIRSILKSDLVSKKINTERIGEFLSYQSVNPPNTIVDEIKQIVPGHYMLYGKGSLREHSYWAPTQHFKPNLMGRAKVKSDIKELLFNSVERRMVSDVPVGAFLSGGIDSTVIVGIMSRLSEKPVQSISMIFKEKGFDESNYSRLIARKFKTNHHEIELDAQGLLNELPSAFAQLDSPAGDFMNSYLIAKWAKNESLTVALSGSGGDELFAGYPVFDQYPRLSRSMLWLLHPDVRRSVSPLISFFLPNHKRARIQELLGLRKVSFEHLYPVFRKIYTERELKQVFNGKISGFSSITQILEKVHNLNEVPLQSRLSIAELITYTQNVLLRDMDRMSMAHSLEVRTPFLDHELVEYIVNLKNDFKKPIGSKRLLIESMDGLVPQEIADRRKQGFTFPWEKWMQGALKEFCTDQIDALENFRLFDMQAVQKNWKSFIAKEQCVPWSQMWLLVVLSNWMNKNGLG